MSEHKGMIPIAKMAGLLRVTIIRGINLVVRDLNTSDPYVILRLANQKLKTRMVENSLNPEWNEDLTLFVTDVNAPLKLDVYDYDSMSLDDKMGNAEVDIKPFLESVKRNTENPSDDETILATVKPDRQNCIAEESNVVWKNGKVMQNILLRLRNVKSGQIELHLKWIDCPSLSSA